MKPSLQLNLPPMAVKRVGIVTPTTANPVAAPLVEVLVRAFTICGFNAQQAAAMQMSAADFSKAFNPNWPDRNPAMKKFDGLDFSIRQQFAALLAVEYEIAEPDVEQTRVVRDFARLLKAVGE